MSKQITNQKEADAAKIAARAERNNHIAALRWLMSDPRGRRFMWNMLEKGHIFGKCYTGTAETYYREGRREVMLEVFNDLLTACPDALSIMQAEQAKPGDTANG